MKLVPEKHRFKAFHTKTLSRLQNDGTVMQVDTKNNHVVFYLENVSQEEIRFSFSIEQNLPVSDTRPASVHIYDYYETGRKPR
uniref:Alpha-macroglobulin receptor-binding domain-containing protein n=1 Tax=Pelusios castaneus TaxID=367368 RepID=A0A8C8S585_9SAUR